MRDSYKIIIIIICLLIVDVSMFWLLGLGKKGNKSIQADGNSSAWEGSQKIDSGLTMDMISIAGMSEIILRADQIDQKVNFHNPEENTCYIVFNLVLDGDVIWQSGYCPPGCGYYSITLNKPVQKGEYDADVLHECFTGDGEKLNSAKIHTKLKVI